MNEKTNLNTSTWLNNIKLPEAFRALKGDVSTEVVVIGEGLTGVLTSYLLSKEGKKVVVLEKKDLTNSVSAYTTAWLNCVVDTDLSDLVKMYTAPVARRIWISGIDAIDLLEKITQEENIDCEFVRVSHYRYAKNRREMGNLIKEYDAIERLGLQYRIQALLHDPESLPWRNFGSLEVKNQAKFHPVKFLIGLRKAAEKYGAVFYENTESHKIEGDESVVISTSSGKVTADYCVIATHQPFNKPKELFAHKGAYVSYVLEADIPKNAIPEGLYQDEAKPYHYFRIDGGQDFDRMILGGEDHRKDIRVPAEKNFRALRAFLNDLFPNMKYDIKREWSGPILETLDGLPYIGRYSKKYENRLVATGFSGNGMTYSAVSAMIFRDIILKRSNPYRDIYAPTRKVRLYNLIIKGRDFGLELIGGAIKNFFQW